MKRDLFDAIVVRFKSKIHNGNKFICWAHEIFVLNKSTTVIITHKPFLEQYGQHVPIDWKKKTIYCPLAPASGTFY